MTWRDDEEEGTLGAEDLARARRRRQGVEVKLKTHANPRLVRKVRGAENEERRKTMMGKTESKKRVSLMSDEGRCEREETIWWDGGP
jgi:hypothetical protein